MRHRSIAHAARIAALAVPFWVLPVLLPGFQGRAATAQAAQQVDVSAASRGGQVTVTASADLQADPATAWAVITDYDHLASFIPYMHSSKVVQRDGDRLLVDQAGELSLLFFRQPIEVRLEVLEMPERSVDAHAVGGNLRAMQGRYLIEPLPSGELRLSYSGGLTPAFQLPPLVGNVVVRMVLARQFQALVAEIVRRDALARRAPPK